MHPEMLLGVLPWRLLGMLEILPVMILLLLWTLKLMLKLINF
jgi:hypothetical protein